MLSRTDNCFVDHCITVILPPPPLFQMKRYELPTFSTLNSTLTVRSNELPPRPLFAEAPPNLAPPNLAPPTSSAPRPTDGSSVVEGLVAAWSSLPRQEPFGRCACSLGLWICSLWFDIRRKGFSFRRLIFFLVRFFVCSFVKLIRKTKILIYDPKTC